MKKTEEENGTGYPDDILSRQWRDPATISGSGESYVITKYRFPFEGDWLMVTSIERPVVWGKYKEEIHAGDDLIAWMPIPRLPKDKMS